MTTVTATVLCENSVYGKLGLLAEHGWSVWIETPDGAYLFDTGQGRTLLLNAKALGKDLANADAILVSHHHLDHTGGLLDAVQTVTHALGSPPRRQIPVHAHPDLFKDSFSSSSATGNEGLRFIGVPHTRSALETAGAGFELSTGWVEVAPRLSMTGEIPRRTTFEHPDPRMRHRDDAGEIVLDPVRDDQTVIIETPSGLFVILGCSHAGLINVLNHIVSTTGQTRMHTVMGGTHLGPAGEEQIAETIRALHDFDIGRIGVSHCTGPVVASRMAQAFGERFFFCGVGSVVSA